MPPPNSLLVTTIVFSIVESVSWIAEKADFKGKNLGSFIIFYNLLLAEKYSEWRNKM